MKLHSLFFGVIRAHHPFDFRDIRITYVAFPVKFILFDISVKSVCLPLLKRRRKLRGGIGIHQSFNVDRRILVRYSDRNAYFPGLFYFACIYRKNLSYCGNVLLTRVKRADRQKIFKCKDITRYGFRH